MPMTAPDENETRSAELRLLVAPVTVREFAAVAIFMPMKPASAENTPPTKKAIGTKNVMKPVAARIARTAVTMTKKIATVLYWRFKYAFAPRLMAAAIFLILSLPSLFFMTPDAVTAANTSAMTAPISAQNTISIDMPSSAFI